MENRLYLYNLGIKTFGGFATLGGVIQALQLFTQPDLDIKSILLSFPACKGGETMRVKVRSV